MAKQFNKRHDNVMRSFDKMECSAEFSQLNFQPAEELDSQGKPRRVILMTKDGFMFLVMSFTGQEAARIKEVYIGAFNEMAGQLQQIAITGFRDLWAQRLELETRDATTFQWASFGAKRMLDRKRELPGLKDEPDPWPSREPAR
jgi:hypothetical protein